jgi:hypothetical protein
MTSTYFGLLAEFGAHNIPLVRVASAYWKLSERTALTMARDQRLPVPAFRGSESQKSEWFVSATDLAKYLDEQRASAAEVWRKVNT